MDEHRRAPGGSWYADGSPDEGRGWAPDDRCDAAAAAGETCAGGGAPPGDEASGAWADAARGAGTPPLCSPTGVEHFSDALPPPYDALSPKSRAANPRPRTVSYGQEEGFMAQWALDVDAAYAASGVPNLVLFEPVQHFLMDLAPTLVPV
ncbi:peptide-aspartate beta-dioxygenase [Aureococcus anophagefferens]|nr:peptide-aspartate beta-dioxygenase [Aureococcus anophagefferens]